jgi:acetyl esterase/lipase
MKSFILFLISLLYLNTSLFAQENQNSKLISWQEINTLALPSPDHIINYGLDSLQFGELRLPDGKGPFPVVVVVHGGCWLSAYNLNYMSHLSKALTNAGYATWNIEFRRVGDQGGGYPGTFKDVGKATDYIKELAKHYPLNTKEVVILGHSAGGHLALWLAGRKNIAKKSILYTRRPLKIKGVVSLAGIPDLESYSKDNGSCNAAVPKLMSGTPNEDKERYSDTSPLLLLPLGVPQKLIQGALDPIVPITQSQRYATTANSKGDLAEVLIVPTAGHFDLVAPHSPVWPVVLKAVEDLLKPGSHKIETSK